MCVEVEVELEVEVCAGQCGQVQSLTGVTDLFSENAGV